MNNLMTGTTDKERDLKIAVDSLKDSCLRLTKYQHRATVDIEDVELVLTALEAERQRAEKVEKQLSAVRKQGEIWERDARYAEAEIAALKAKLDIIHGLIDVKNELEKNFINK